MSLPLITVIGSLNIDLVTVTPRIPAAGETLTATSFSTGFGGKGANQCVACARLSLPQISLSQLSREPFVNVRMIGAVGSDQFGIDMRNSLDGDGIDVTGVRVIEGAKTGTAVILVEEGGENRILLAPGANGGLKVEDRLLEVKDMGGEVVVMQLEVPLEVVVRNIEQASAQGAHVILNPAPAIPLPIKIYCKINSLIMNETEALLLSKLPITEVARFANIDAATEICESFIKKGVTIVVITLGADGVIYQTKRMVTMSMKATKVSAVKTKVVDTTAAGDTFVGAFAVWMASRGMGRKVDVEGDSLVHGAIEFATRAAAKTVEKAGAQSAIPWLDEVFEL